VPADAEDRKRAQRAVAELERAALDDPDVTLVDIALAPGHSGDENTQELVLRVHLRRVSPEIAGRFPTEIDGYRVVVVPGDYQLDS
jgi:hypothetical protein